MNFTVMSDLHGNISTVSVLEQSDSVLLIPGDIHETKRTGQYRDILSVLTAKFKAVVMVPGNHEYYGSNFVKTHRTLREFESEFKNFHFLDNESLVLGDVRILGGTLWTDYDRGNPISKMQAQLGMNDYRNIRTGPPEQYWMRKIEPDDLEFMHFKTKDFLRKSLDSETDSCENLKTLVLTHHAPSFKSADPAYANDGLNGCYCSDMDDFIYASDISVWVHGHIHCSNDYVLGNTRVICNPLGYEFSAGQFENPDFNSTLTFEV